MSERIECPPCADGDHAGANYTGQCECCGEVVEMPMRMRDLLDPLGSPAPGMNGSHLPEAEEDHG